MSIGTPEAVPGGAGTIRPLSASKEQAQGERQTCVPIRLISDFPALFD
jgi:hypothetical protein